MEMVPGPPVEDLETDRHRCGVDLCVELGEENAPTVEQSGNRKGRPYSLIFFKKPGVFNSRSSR